MWNQVRYIPLHKKLSVNITVRVVRTLQMHRITGRSVSSGNVFLAATYNPFMVSILNAVYSPAKPNESSTPIPAEMQEPTEHIYLFIQTLPNSASNTVSPV